MLGLLTIFLAIACIGGSLKALWVFETREKLDKFLAIIKEHEIEFELSSTGNRDTNITLFVDEQDFSLAKRLLLKHRKRRTSSDR